MDRNGKKFEDISETPEEVVALIGNIANRPDIRAIQDRQVKEINNLIAVKLQEVKDIIDEKIDEVEGVGPPTSLHATFFDKDSEEMSEAELAALFNEKPGSRKKKPKKLKNMSLEEIESWEKQQDNSNDIYKVSARVKNSARMAVKGNLTAQGDMVVNMFTHMIKAMYDFAETIPDKSTKIRLIELTRKQEELPGNLLAALGVGVRV